MGRDTVALERPSGEPPGVVLVVAGAVWRIRSRLLKETKERRCSHGPCSGGGTAHCMIPAPHVPESFREVEHHKSEANAAALPLRPPSLPQMMQVDVQNGRQRIAGTRCYGHVRCGYLDG
jgi:hypothetical protein